MPSKELIRLMDAVINGDEGALEHLKEAADSKQQALAPKPESFVISSILNNDHASATKVYDLLNQALGSDWWEYEIETVERLIFTKCAVALEPVNRDKVLAIRHVCRSDRCFHDWFEFNQVALSFAGCIADFDALRSPSPGMVVCAIKVLEHIRLDRNGYFGDDVVKYACLLFINEGLYIPPVSIATEIGDKFRDLVSPEMVKLWPKIIDRYKELVLKNDSDVDETVVDIQAKRMLRTESAALKYQE